MECQLRFAAVCGFESRHDDKHLHPCGKTTRRSNNLKQQSNGELFGNDGLQLPGLGMEGSGKDVGSTGSDWCHYFGADGVVDGVGRLVRDVVRVTTAIP